MQETKCSARCNLLFKLTDVGDGGMLTAQYRRVIVNHDCNTVVIERQSGNFHISRRFPVEQRLLHFKKISQCILLFCCRILQSFHKLNGASIHDGTFRTVKLDDNIIDLQSDKRSESMFNGADACATLFNGGASGNIYNILAIGTDDGRAREVYTLKFDTVIRFGRQESHVRLNSGVKTNA